MSGQTQYGFDWGPVVVERMAHIEGRGYCVSIRGREDYTGPEIQVLVSEKGRSVTAYPIRGGKVRTPRDDQAGAEDPVSLKRARGSSA